jgi:NADH pyrophosphatase NudC (nudix superfamily)
MKFMAERGAGSFVNIDDTDPVGARALQKLKNQDYASAGLVDAGAEKFFIRRGPEGRWCPACPNNTIHHSWTRICPSCGAETAPESEMARDLPGGQYMP